MIHNKEIGVLYDVNNPSDQEIYSKALEHIKFIEENSNDKPFELNSGNAIQSGKVEKPDESKQPVFRTLAHQSSLILLSHRFMVNALIKSRQF